MIIANSVVFAEQYPFVEGFINNGQQDEFILPQSARRDLSRLAETNEAGRVLEKGERPKSVRRACRDVVQPP